MRKSHATAKELPSLPLRACVRACVCVCVCVCDDMLNHNHHRHHDQAGFQARREEAVSASARELHEVHRQALRRAMAAKDLEADQVSTRGA